MSLCSLVICISFGIQQEGFLLKKETTGFHRWQR
eukprot:g17275.t1